jgi:DNA-binding NarL/FixJ family response regulator
MRDLTPEELDAVCGGARQVDTSILPRTPPSPAAPAHLTPRQAQCLAWVAAGKTSAEFGAVLGLSPLSVDTYLKAA